jgi:hypothetical protein
VRWIKTVAAMRKTKPRGLPKVDWASTFAAAAYNLVRRREGALSLRVTPHRTELTGDRKPPVHAAWAAFVGEKRYRFAAPALGIKPKLPEIANEDARH